MQFATCTSLIVHPICPPPQILHNLCFSFILGITDACVQTSPNSLIDVCTQASITAVPREIENKAYAKFMGDK